MLPQHQTRSTCPGRVHKCLDALHQTSGASLAASQKHFHWHSCVTVLLAVPRIGLSILASAARSSRVAPVGRRLVVVALMSLFFLTLGYLCPSTYTQVVSSHSLSGRLQTQGSPRVCTQKPEGGGGRCAPKGASVNLSVCLSVCWRHPSPPPVHGYPSTTMVWIMLSYVSMVRWGDAGVGGRLQTADVSEFLVELLEVLLNIRRMMLSEAD